MLKPNTFLMFSLFALMAVVIWENRGKTFDTMWHKITGRSNRFSSLIWAVLNLSLILATLRNILHGNQSVFWIFIDLCFPGESDLKTILERFTRKISNKDGIFLWQCKSCNKLIKRKSHLIEHIESNHISGLQFKCPYCALFYKTRSSVRSHVHDKHKNDHLLYKMDMANLEWLIQDPVQNQMNVSYWKLYK